MPKSIFLSLAGLLLFSGLLAACDGSDEDKVATAEALCLELGDLADSLDGEGNCPTRIAITNLTAKAEPTVDYLTPFPPYNEGEGPCRDAKFRITHAPPTDRVFHQGEKLEVEIQYDAPGCKRIAATFGVRHQPESPRFDYYCATPIVGRIENVCSHGFNGNISSDWVTLDSGTGTVTLVAMPGEFPPTSLESVPDLEGAKICAVVLQVDDDIPGGSRSSQQINLACPEDHYPPFD